ncbi:MAG: MFS transporter [Rubrivivax sp.]|nr:MFS transporter [Pyrinomonadaceae bacterium]
MATAKTQGQTTGTSRAGGMFRALAHRNFRLFWAGAFLSNVGTWMQSLAQGWLVLQLTNSGTWLGVDNFVATVPGLLLTLVGGVIADLVDRKRLLIITQAGAGVSALVLGVLILTGTVKVWMILVLSFVTGCCWAISGPAYQAITVDLVEREDFANAIALNSSQFQLARVVGPLLAGLTISFFGMAGCFLLNGLSYVAICAALARVRFNKAETRPSGSVSMSVEDDTLPDGRVSDTDGRAGHSLTDRRAMWRDLVEGFSYVRGRPRVSVILLCSTVVCLFGTPYLVLMPLFAKNVYGWDETGLSLLMGTAGAGALCGALALAYLGDFRRKGWFLLCSMLAGGACIASFASATRPATALPLLFGVGVSMVSFFAVGNTILQQLVTNEMRGRVMSMWVLTFIGTMPVGSYIAGALADRFGPGQTLAVCGLVIVVFSLAVGALTPRLREI